MPILTAVSITITCCFGAVQERAANPPPLGESHCKSSFRYSISIINYLNIGRLTGCFGPNLQKLNFQKLLLSATPYSVSGVVSRAVKIISFIRNIFKSYKFAHRHILSVMLLESRKCATEIIKSH